MTGIEAISTQTSPPGQLEAVERRQAQATENREEARAKAEAARSRRNEKAEAREDGEISQDTLTRVLGENARLSIEAHEKSGDYIYKSVDKKTGEVIQQWPPEKFLRFIEAQLERAEVSDRPSGVIADEKA